MILSVFVLIVQVHKCLRGNQLRAVSAILVLLHKNL